MRESRVGIRGASSGFTLPRDVHATVIPAGTPVLLLAGDEVTVMQALGTTATVTTGDGEMVRLSTADSVEFGFVDEAAVRPVAEGAFSLDGVGGCRHRVRPRDPDDIVELGLVYRVEPSDLPSGNKRVDIDMSVTAALRDGRHHA